MEIKYVFWLVIVGMVGIITIFCFVLISNPTIEVYANDEMVAVSENVLVVERDENFNNCLVQCNDLPEMDGMSCYESCQIHYSSKGDLFYKGAYESCKGSETKRFETYLQKVQEYNSQIEVLKYYLESCNNGCNFINNERN